MDWGYQWFRYTEEKGFENKIKKLGSHKIGYIFHKNTNAI